MGAKKARRLELTEALHARLWGDRTPKAPAAVPKASLARAALPGASPAAAVDIPQLRLFGAAHGLKSGGSGVALPLPPLPPLPT